MKNSRSGLAFGAAAYLCWGFFPLYWPLLSPASSWEVLAHRMVWTLVFCTILLTVTRSWSALGAVLHNRAVMWRLSVAALVITFNWGGFIWGVTHGYVIETSLGYFINPLVTVLLGVLVLGERLRPWQWAAVAVGAAAVAVLTVGYGRPPWIALLLAFSFATYGFFKKSADVGTITSLSVETMVLTPFALTYLIYLQASGSLTFGHHGVGNTVLLMLTGLVTGIPLLLFGAAATRLSLTTIGILQYLGPILQFAFGLLLFKEHMDPTRWIGFTLVWAALVIFTVDGLRRGPARAVEESGPAFAE